MIKERLAVFNRRAKVKLGSFWTQAKYKFHGGFKCGDCGKVIPTEGTRVDGSANGRRMIFQSYHKGARCAACTYDRLSSWWLLSWRVTDDGPVTGHCEWMKKKDEVIKWVGGFDAPDIAEDLNIRFGSNSWNGHWASLAAFEELLLHTGMYTSDYIGPFNRDNTGSSLMTYMVGPRYCIKVEHGEKLNVNYSSTKRTR